MAAPTRVVAEAMPGRAVPEAMPGCDAAGPGSVAVIGGGIAGLAAAHALARAGAAVTLFEASDRVGGLGTFFEYRGHPLERFYHCMLPSDRHLLPLLSELGLAADVYWKETSFGFLRGGRLYRLDTPQDLLRFAPLPFIDRLRVGATGVWGSLRGAGGLDDMTCEDWLTGLSGRRAFETFWKPMLQAKFGDRYREVPALWFWTRFNREKGGKKECKGYLRGGYRRIAQALVDAIVARGGTLRLSAPVAALDIAGDGRPSVRTRTAAPEVFDRVVFTGPVTALAPLLAGGRLADLTDRAGVGIDMQGVVNAVLLLRRGLTPHYWVATIDPGLPFQGVVESTTLLDRAATGGLHLVYLMNYLHRTDPRFARDDTATLADSVAGLQRLFPDLRADDIVDRFVFRSAFVEPLYTVGYQQRMPPTALLPGRLYLATTAQVYPEVTSWNGSVGLANRVVAQMLTECRDLAERAV
ncbi:MAG: FAD-dependent oxidoreductase [Lautropia sp.]